MLFFLSKLASAAVLFSDVVLVISYFVGLVWRVVMNTNLLKVELLSKRGHCFTLDISTAFDLWDTSLQKLDLTSTVGIFDMLDLKLSNFFM